VPLYQFFVPADSATATRKAEVARAVTATHSAVTGAPERYVNVSFVDVPAGSLFAAGEPVEHGRMVGIIRSGRSPEVKQRLITQLAQAWSEVTGEPLEGLALFVQEVPGSSMLEDGQLLPEAVED
jgi:phenylpyruvate tautomerase PptA (4-oxalocrotonate tautomerase family)